ncbi:hypothetical protein [Cryobacterium sp. PH31-L1]|uniref:hypothetical protein n=1 Tax=Cryobacterium sp. PH31-L1 TaxID=3046199 RepID=UPI0024BAAD01|nr:hypothetical protein [Cryobacterium sp. PH31-L1]MDJ0377390.1 hypothetical protein [Cryobacterium sp. PH31-L1]
MPGVRDGLVHGDLTVSVGGTTIVATDEVLAQAQFLNVLRNDVADWAGRAHRIRNLDPNWPANWLGQDPWPDLLQVAGRLNSLHEYCGVIADNLIAAARSYGYVERVAREAALMGAADLAYGLGRLLRGGLVALTGTPLGVSMAGVAGVGHIWLYGSLRSPYRARAARIGTDKLDPRLLTNPTVVALLRAAASSLDDVAWGLAGTPRSVGRAFGDEGLGVIDTSRTAFGVLAVARKDGLLRESPVSVAAVGDSTQPMPPTGVGDLASRIPKAVAGKPQVRIENYGDTEHPSWAVYISGTVEWDAIAKTDPLDLTSNITAMAGQAAGSFETVISAMKAAGIAPSDPVVLAGHSQGGLIATQVAAYSWFNVQAVATFGAPESKVPVPDGVATLTVEHTDDIVPAMGGDSLTDSADRVTVRREAFASEPLPAGAALPAHNLDTYRETALLIDASPEENLQGFRDTVTGILGSESGGAVLWHGIRVPEGPAPQ